MQADPKLRHLMVALLGQQIHWVTIAPFLADPGSDNIAQFPAVEPGPTVLDTTPGNIFDSERWDQAGGSEMQWAFDVAAEGLYNVRLYLGNGFEGTSEPGERVFHVAMEGNIPSTADDIDLSNQFGHLVGGVINNTVSVTDGTLNIEFLHGVENPLINGIEIVQVDDQPPTTPAVSIVGGPYTVGENDGQVQISLLTDVTVPSSESVDVTFEITPGTATVQEDYEYLSPTATFDAQTGTYTDTVSIAGNSSDVTFLIDILEDTIAEADEAFAVNITDVSPNAQIGAGSTSVTITDGESLSGAAILAVTADSDDVQVSNFGGNSFQLTNTGDKQIAQVDIDVTNALYPDSVFDPFGLAGDLVSKELTIDTNGSTGVVSPSNGSYIGTGGTAGFEGLQILFDEGVDGGFEAGETLGFSVDMDPNSIAGAEKEVLDSGANPPWDIGGISGAELIGSNYTVTFVDGTTATGQLQGNNNQGGAQGLASQSSSDLSVSLTANGLEAGGVGTYNETAPSVSINGPAGQTARVVLTKGFIQPETNEFFNSTDPDDQAYAPVLQGQLDALAASDFPANNAVEFQTIDVELTGGEQDISNLFNFSDVTNFDFEGEDQVPLGFVAGIIDPTNDDLPLGPVTQPIYLQFDEQLSNAAPIFTTAASVTVPENQTAVVDVNATDTGGDTEGNGLTYSLTGGIDQGAFALDANTGVLSFATSPDFENPGDDNNNNIYEVEVTVTDSDGLTALQQLDVTISDVDETPSGETFQIEGEDVTDVTGYRIENNNFASGGQMLSLVGQEGGEVGTGTFAFSGVSGQYNVVLGTFDENDGQASLEIAQNGNTIGTALLDQDPGGNAPSANTQVELTIATDVAITNGDNFTVTGFEAGSEHARFDFVRFEPIDGDNEPPSSSPIRLEAESANNITNYRTENIGVASGGQALTFLGGSTNEVGNATFGFNEAPGAYDIVVGTFDENDGIAQFIVELNDVETGSTTEIGSLELDATLGSNIPNAQTAINPTVAFGVSLTPGDSITVNGFENGNEHARLDYIEFLPVV